MEKLICLGESTQYRFENCQFVHLPFDEIASIAMSAECQPAAAAPDHPLSDRVHKIFLPVLE